MESQATQSSPALTSVSNYEQQAQLQAQIRQLAQRDREVRSHEQAHAAAGGVHASQPHYQFTKGPNGVRYASSGHVNIDISVVAGDPKATLDKMQQVHRAALAPVQPSAQDRAVTAKASAQAAQARAQLLQQQNEQAEAAQQQPGASTTPGRANSSEFGSTRGGQIDLYA